MKNSMLMCTLAAAMAFAPGSSPAADDSSEGFGDLFGGGGGYVHPYVTVAGLYDDNVYRTPDNEISDYAGVLSPGIWIAVPGVKEQRQLLNTSTLTPGGLGLVEDRGEEFRRFRGFLHYGAALTRYQEEEDNDTDDQRVDALLQFGLPGGLTFDLLDVYLDGHDERGEGAFGELDTYKSNLAGARVTYDIGSRFRLRGEYGHFTVAYDEDDQSYLDRADDKVAAYLYYKLSGRSTVFAEYDFVDIGYDSTPEYDSTESTGWGGFRWRLSDKTMGEIKLGYLNKDYDRADLEDAGDLVVKGWLDYEWTDKSRFRLTASRMTEEPDANTSQAATTDQVRLAFIHDLTAKIKGRIEAGYGQTDYDGPYTYQGVTGERDDDKYTGRLGLDYQIQDWLGTKLEYTYLDRESSFSDLSYTDNRVVLSLSLAM